jgi:hypothetical protein
MTTLLTLLLLALIAWFWLDSMRAREIACGISKETCERLGVQFLDDTVALQRLRTGRNAAGHLRLLRTYQFEFTDTGAQRSSGVISLLGIDVVRLVVGANIIR